MDQKLFDRFTGIDEQLAEMIPLLRSMAAKELTVNFPEQLDGAISLRDIYNLLKETRDASLEIFFMTYPNDGTRATFDVGTTILNFEQGTVEAPDGNITGMSSSLVKKGKDFMRSFAINCDQDTIVRLDNDDQTPVRANTWGKMTYQQYTKARVTTTVSTTGYVHACTNPEAIHEQIGEVTIMIGREERNQLKSDKDTHFSGAIAQNAIESENITGLTANEITITGISMIGDENLSYRVWLFETDDFQESDLDNDEFVEFVDLDLSANGARIAGAGAYYYAQTNLNIDYEDLDATNELHIALQNLSAGAKTAGAAGEIVLKISYIPRI